MLNGLGLQERVGRDEVARVCGQSGSVEDPTEIKSLRSCVGSRLVALPHRLAWRRSAARELSLLLLLAWWQGLSLAATSLVQGWIPCEQTGEGLLCRRDVAVASTFLPPLWSVISEYCHS